MARILAAFYNGVYDEKNLSKMPSWYESFFQGLCDAGNDILVFAIESFLRDYSEISTCLKQKITEYNPELCILFNNVFYDLSFLDCPILIYEADSVLFWNNRERLLSKKDRFLYAMNSDGEVSYLQNVLGVPRRYILAAKPFTSVVRNQKVNYETNISFIGTRFGVRREVEVGSLENESQQAREEYASCLSYISKNPFAENGEVLQNLQIQSEYVKENLDVPSVVMMLSAEKRVRVLSAVVDLGLKLYGTRTWMTRYHFDSRINCSFVDKSVYSLIDNQNIYNESKIGINISHLQAQNAFPWRVLDIMASNACLVSDGWSGVKQFFGELPIPIYNDEFEARNICKRLLENEDERLDIVEKCNQYVEENHRFIHLLVQLEDFLEISLQNNCKGSITVVDYSTWE